LKKRKIDLISIGADGDSRELRAMQLSTQLLSTNQGSTNQHSKNQGSVLSLGSIITIPPTWKTWFALKQPTGIAYIQDIIHVVVKLKMRLLTPSIVLPLGKYLAGVHHLRIVQQNYSKAEHGMREKDINFKDKQNYEAVVRMTNKAVTNLLEDIPDGKGTRIYLDLMKSINDCFLDKDLEILNRIEKAWYVVFFLRYWRQWIILNPTFNVNDNFVTINTYMCIELNAHSLLIYILTLQNKPTHSESFLPWLLGSQCCKKIFRAARSMSSTFSMVINFGVLGLVRRLHRLQVLLQLESECKDLNYPITGSHKEKEASICDLHGVTLEEISVC